MTFANPSIAIGLLLVLLEVLAAVLFVRPLRLFVVRRFVMPGMTRALHGLGNRNATATAIALPAAQDGLDAGPSRTRALLTAPAADGEGLGGLVQPLARIAGCTYMNDATQLLANDASSPVLSASLTQHSTWLLHDAIDDAVQALAMPDREVAPRARSAALDVRLEAEPRIMQRQRRASVIAVHWHPFASRELQAARAQDIAGFDHVLRAHLRFTIQSAGQALWRALADSLRLRPPAKRASQHYLRRLARLGPAFALVSNGVLFTRSAGQARRERLLARLADALAFMQLTAATLQHHARNDAPPRDRPLLCWSCEYAVSRVHEALDGVLDNLPNRVAALLLRAVIFPLGVQAAPPSDALEMEAARALLADGPQCVLLARAGAARSQRAPHMPPLAVAAAAGGSRLERMGQRIEQAG